MDFNNNYNEPDYLSYKQSKMTARKDKPISKVNYVFQLFVVTFVIIFVAIVFSIMKYSSKIDIEYSKGDLSFTENDTPVSVHQLEPEDAPRQIDKRLISLQQEENAPSEAKIIEKQKVKDEVIDPKVVQENQKIDKIEKIKEQNAQESGIKLKNKQEVPKLINDNLIISSKVLVGRFNSLDDAKAYQNQIKNDIPTTAYVRKLGDIFCIQIGSFNDFQVAKSHAQQLKSKGYEVWIYQQ